MMQLVDVTDDCEVHDFCEMSASHQCMMDTKEQKVDSALVNYGTQDVACDVVLQRSCRVKMLALYLLLCLRLLGVCCQTPGRNKNSRNVTFSWLGGASEALRWEESKG